LNNTRKNSLKIEGIPENVCNDEDAVLKVAEALNEKISTSVIESKEKRRGLS